MNARPNWLAVAEARNHSIAAWVGSQDHPTDCLCPELCAPISTPTCSPSLNAALAGGRGSDLAQAVTLFESLMPYGRRVAIGHLRALSGLQRKLR